MSDARTPESIRDMFIEEQNRIIQYVDLLNRKLSVRADDTRRLHDILYRNGLSPSFHLGFYHGRDEIHTLGYLRTIWSKIEPIITDLQSCHRQWLNTRKRIPPPSLDQEKLGQDQRDAFEHREIYEALVDWFDGCGHIPSEEDVETAVSSISSDYPSETSHTPPDVLRRLSQFAYLNTIYNRTNETSWALELVYEIRQVLLVAEDPTISPLRQGFILLMTIFDASVFDLVRQALHKDFFGLIKRFSSEKEAVALQQLSNPSLPVEFRGYIIERQLHGKYVGELLNLLSNEKVQLVDGSTGKTLEYLFELVRRRNIHLHNRGVVDADYLSTNKGSRNVFGLTEGTLADINETYWQNANAIVEFCVMQIYAWVDGLNPS